MVTARQCFSGISFLPFFLPSLICNDFNECEMSFQPEVC